MTVKDFLVSTLDYNSYQLIITEFGDDNILFNEYMNDDYYDKGCKFDNKKVAAIKFGNDWVKIILEYGEI